MISSIPDWNSQGVVPPIELLDPVSRNRSPYLVSLETFIRHYALSPERIAILRGFLEYRVQLHVIGLTQGFQWLNGSFLENKELRLGTPPGDIDVVTFFELPSNLAEADLVSQNFWLFDPAQHEDLKHRFHVDSNFQPLYVPAERLVGGSNYWYGMWAHQRDTFIWKGFCQVSLSSGEDAAALNFLLNLPGGTTP